jgi:hypothetical protein
VTPHAATDLTDPDLGRICVVPARMAAGAHSALPLVLQGALIDEFHRPSECPR